MMRRDGRIAKRAHGFTLDDVASSEIPKCWWSDDEAVERVAGASSLAEVLEVLAWVPVPAKARVLGRADQVRAARADAACREGWDDVRLPWGDDGEEVKF